MTKEKNKPQALARLDPRAIPHIAGILKALGHPQRLRLVEILARGETSVGALQEKLGASQAIVSQQLRILRTSGIVTFRRQGTLSFYSLAIPGLLSLLTCLHSCQHHCLARMGNPADGPTDSTQGA